jgi:hypothetical protein
MNKETIQSKILEVGGQKVIQVNIAILQAFVFIRQYAFYIKL